MENFKDKVAIVSGDGSLGCRHNLVGHRGSKKRFFDLYGSERDSNWLYKRLCLP